MLRWLVGLLLLANGVFYAWSQGWLDGLGPAPQGEREPGRAQRQQQPQAVRLMPLPAASAAAASAPVATAAAAAAAAAASEACLELGPFTAADAAAAEAALAQAAVPAGAWRRVSVAQPPRWIVYMGRFPDREALARKIDEVRRRGVAFEVLSGSPEHQPGLSLGSHGSREGAEAQLAALVAKDVRTARVLALEMPPQAALRVDSADAGLREQLVALRGGALGQGFTPCAAR